MNIIKILIVGDIFSRLGRETFERNLAKIKEQHKINLVIVNGENISHGKGMNEGHYRWLLNQGVNVITMGNHTFNQRSITNVIDESNVLIRPYNYKEEVPGKGYITINYNGIKITVLQMLGRILMNEDVECPFIKTAEILEKVPSDIYISDFHAETTSEKIAYGYAFDGKIQIVYGTHTHVQTNDARILENGSFFITDLGMTGPLDGVIGVDRETIVDRYVNRSMRRFNPQESGKTQFSGAIIEIDEKTHKVTNFDILYVIE